MLPARHRLTTAGDFQSTIRRGVRAGRPTLVVHARHNDRGITRVGFVVSRAVGNAVTRNLVKRRLRHLGRGLLTVEPACDVVVRALPPAAGRDHAGLEHDLVGAWRSCLRKLGQE